MKTTYERQVSRMILAVLVFPLLVGVLFLPASDAVAGNVRAFVTALDQQLFYNRLGAVNPNGMIYALSRDVVAVNPAAPLGTGNVMLRPDKRPRPIVLRMNVGDTMIITFDNFLAPAARGEQPATRNASIHVLGMELVRDIGSDGSNVGENPSSLVPPGGRRIFRFTAEREGTYLLYNGGSVTGGEGGGGSLAFGLFGAVQVEPAGAEWYRSQVTRDDLDLATTGFTAAGHPILNYDVVYPVGHRFAGLPILKMYTGTAADRTIVHSDLNAIITGPNRGFFSHYPSSPVYNPATDEATPRTRNEPFREFSVIFHDEVALVQAFPATFNHPVFNHTLHSVRDGFAINYGTGGIGAEILADRLGIGPGSECLECGYEEFFLSSWVVGDPATVVDIPANVSPGGPVATKALYPDDVSNVFSSYIGDHVKIRNLHAGPKEHHIFHLHAHQWVFTPDDDKSTYLDSQFIGPGSGYTYEIAYNGSGNRNQTPGDAIFHCHFYPHFAQGMWALWRNHDVFEMGTELVIDLDGLPIPKPGSRALPDGEIAAGIPIAAIVPLPHRPMAPMPGPVTVKAVPPLPGSQVSFDADLVTGFAGNPLLAATDNPGYPFFIPGVAGHRPPHPPLDTIIDGGLPRHVIVGGTANFPPLNRLDFNKEIVTADAVPLPESGTAVESVAMDFHGRRFHDTFLPNGNPAPGNTGFRTNGLPPQPGAPFADPCISDLGVPVGNPRLYKAAAIQIDMVMSKVGWHFPQSRILALNADVADTLSGARPPEPLFFRANTNDCIEYQHTNLVPDDYFLDDFQVKTPTDILGQHIHLVKFDVTSSDGSGNGWNYEDGTFSPEMVTERIDAINAGTWNGNPNPGLQAQIHPFFGVEGAQTTVQRWYADNVLDNQGRDRTLGTVFTHDHFGPSTHQQAGLYASLVIEPEGSTWWDNEVVVQLGTRDDGGPTSWAARIHTADPAASYREFLFQFADFQLAYVAGAGGTPDNPVPDPGGEINGPAKEDAGLPFLVERLAVCPGGEAPPCPEAISAADVGTFSVNYRTEPVPLRVLDPALADANNPAGKQALGLAGDLAHAYRSNIERSVVEMNSQPAFYPDLTGGLFPGDPFTPMMRVYENDKVQVRIQVGATEEGHVFNIHGVKWLQEPASPNSGYRNAQGIGISEHFELLVPGLTTVRDLFNDYLYQMDGSVDGLWNGLWGVMRAYNGGFGLQPDLQPLPSNPSGFIAPTNKGDFRGICPNGAPIRRFDVTAVAASQALPVDAQVGRRTLVYNDRVGQPISGFPGPLNDPTAILYVATDDVKANGRLRRRARQNIEPLILRANAGDCIEVTLRNRLPETLHGPDPAFPLNTADLAGFRSMPFIVDDFNANQVAPSTHVGLHAQLVDYHVFNSDGFNVGFNSVQTAPPGGVTTYRWYAGNVTSNPDGSLTATPVEFGAINLMPADPIKQGDKGLIGALIIEPRGATWTTDGDRFDAAATVRGGNGSVLFREFVVLHQTDVNLRSSNNLAIPNLGGEDDAEDSGHKALNYATEPMWFRFGYPPNTPVDLLHAMDFTNAFSNVQVGGDPATPVFTADAGTPVRFRVLMPSGHARNVVFQVHGHAWEREPYVLDSTVIGHNPLSQWIGAQEGIGPANHFDVVLKSAGGIRRVPGDYLYRDQASFGVDGGLWGIMRVE